MGAEVSVEPSGAGLLGADAKEIWAGCLVGDSLGEVRAAAVRKRWACVARKVVQHGALHRLVVVSH